MTSFIFDPKRYPTQPGCYLMKDYGGKVIYVGKANNLRHRLASYFQPRQKNRRTKRLIARIGDIEIILVNNETESLILENNLIKLHKPRFNRSLMREDTGYPYIVLTAEDFPRFVPYRKNHVNKELARVKGAEKRFGPYINRRFRDALLAFVIENFQLRTCHPMPKKVCLSYHLGLCSGICEQKISAAQYVADVERAVAFLSRQQTDLIRQMKNQMWEHAENLEFEKAQRIRDQVEVLESALEKQIVERDVKHDQDVIYFGEDKALVTSIKCGILQRLRLFDLELASGYGEVGEHFLLTHYTRNSPSELIINCLSNPAEIEARLTVANRYPVKITLPEGGVKYELLQLCKQNYDYRISVIVNKLWNNGDLELCLINTQQPSKKYFKQNANG
jgi:excinuclease ABC subunit C